MPPDPTITAASRDAAEHLPTGAIATTAFLAAVITLHNAILDSTQPPTTPSHSTFSTTLANRPATLLNRAADLTTRTQSDRSAPSAVLQLLALTLPHLTPFCPPEPARSLQAWSDQHLRDTHRKARSRFNAAVTLSPHRPTLQESDITAPLLLYDLATPLTKDELDALLTELSPDTQRLDAPATAHTTHAQRHPAATTAAADKWHLPRIFFPTKIKLDSPSTGSTANGATATTEAPDTGTPTPPGHNR